jgi:hypothetical protein
MTLAVCAGVLAGGCSTGKVNWGCRVGSYTFDQAVLELGPPDKQATLTDGTRVADWMTRSGGVRRVAVGGPYGYGPYGYSALHPAYVEHQVPDTFLRLIFDPEGNLREWKKLAR